MRITRKFLNEKLSDPNGFTIADLFETSADKFGDQHKALQYVGCEHWPERSLTFKQLDDAANQVAHWAVEREGLKKGDVVALFMENRLEYIIYWLGLCKAGVAIAFINNTIKNHPLVHSIAISNAKLVIFGIEVADAIRDVFRDLIRGHGIDLVCSGGDGVPFARSMDGEVAVQPTTRLDRLKYRGGIKLTDLFGNIYTSGTTGLPKAVNVTHLKQLGFALGKNVTEADVLYSSGLPLYHSAANGIGTGMMIVYGCCQVIRRKFSATAWLADVRKYKATVVQYIGELCRYIHATPQLPDDGENTIRLATGNGLTREIWYDFQTRFKIDEIQEFYGATEGNGSFIITVELQELLRGNLAGIGCIGKMTVQEKEKRGIRFVKYDYEADDLVRDAKTGALIDCALDEPGECIFQQMEKNPLTKFVGYSDPKATKKKVVEDGGKFYVRMGDLLVHTKDGYVKFVDRLGQTFRFRGENVSTGEVAAEMNRFPPILESNVYGVQVPHVEGKAGMAAIVFREKQSEKHLDETLSNLLKHCRANLPSYAIPIFLRIQQSTAVTGTFKHQKVQLMKEGINLENMGDDTIYWLEPTSKTYQHFTMEDYKHVQNPPGGRSKL